MKKIQLSLFFLLGLLLFSSCEREESVGNSEINTKKPDLTNLDKWIRENYTEPYNIEAIYKWNENASAANRYLHPPIIDSVLPALKAVKKIWLDSYSEVGGEDFVKKIAPRELQLIGGINLNPSGTITLGLAEGGKRITFFNTDFLDVKNESNLIRFVSTIQHEYCHILNQTVPFDQAAYQLITPIGYTAQWFNEDISSSRELGFITDYARASVTEDFAEMVNIMLSNNNENYNAIIDAITSTEARANIRKKEALIVEYYKSNFNIDLYELQAVAARNTQDVLNN